MDNKTTEQLTTQTIHNKTSELLHRQYITKQLHKQYITKQLLRQYITKQLLRQYITKHQYNYTDNT